MLQLHLNNQYNQLCVVYLTLHFSPYANLESHLDGVWLLFSQVMTAILDGWQKNHNNKMDYQVYLPITRLNLTIITTSETGSQMLWEYQFQD